MGKAARRWYSAALVLTAAGLLSLAPYGCATARDSLEPAVRSFAYALDAICAYRARQTGVSPSYDAGTAPTRN